MYDVNDTHYLTRDEFVMLLKTCLAGLSKVCELHEDQHILRTIEHLAPTLFTKMTREKRASRDQFLTFMVGSPSAVSIMCRVGTTDADEVRGKGEEGGLSYSALLVGSSISSSLCSLPWPIVQVRPAPAKGQPWPVMDWAAEYVFACSHAVFFMLFTSRIFPR